jgi:hypothetical protein
MFSVIWALAPLMGLLRNIFHSQATTSVLFKYFRQPVVSNSSRCTWFFNLSPAV